MGNKSTTLQGCFIFTKLLDDGLDNIIWDWGSQGEGHENKMSSSSFRLSESRTSTVEIFSSDSFLNFES